MTPMQNDLRKTAAARRVLLVAHRGAWGGDIDLANLGF